MSCSPPKDIWWWEHWSMKTHFPAGSSCLRTWIGECSNLARIFPRWSRFTKRKNNNWIMNTASPAPTSDWIHLSVDLLCIFSSLRVSWRRRWWKFSKGLWLMLFFYSIIKSYINACCLFSTTIKRCHDADMKNQQIPAHVPPVGSEREWWSQMKEKRRWSGEGCVIQRPMVYWSLRRLSLFLSSQQGGVNCTVFFRSDWRLPSLRAVFSNSHWYFQQTEMISFCRLWHCLLNDTILWVRTASELTGDEC